MIIPTTKASLQVNTLHQNKGFEIIRIRPVEIINQTITILHLIDTNQYYKLIEDIELKITNLHIPPNSLIESQIQRLKTKIKSISLRTSTYRKKRGLLNIIGSAQKFLFGTMDNEDRNDILTHLNLLSENNHNAIENLNKQITVNDHSQKRIDLLQSIMQSDRDTINTAIENLKTKNNHIAVQVLYADIILKLNYIEDKVNQIQNSIASARNHILHPNILTSDEIMTYDIDFYKLQLIKLDIMYYKDDLLVIALKIPLNFYTTDLRAIFPMPNSNFYEIDDNVEYFVNVNNITYTFKENTPLKYLDISSSCIVMENCKLRVNKKFQIINVDDETIIIKNAIRKKLIQNCDDRELTLNGNYLISFYNCEIQIDNFIYLNKNERVFDKFHYETDINAFTENFNISFQNISLEKNYQNIREIKELKLHKNISYGINISITITIIIIIIILICFQKKNQVKIKINEPSPKVKEIEKKYEIEE